MSNNAQQGITRRRLLQGATLAGLLCVLRPTNIFAASTQQRLDAARKDYEKAKAELDRIADEVAQASSELAKTMGRVESVTNDIARLDADIAQQKADIKKRQEVLASRISKDYKGGRANIFNILLQSASFEELTSNIYYFGKISKHDQNLIEEIRVAQAKLESQMEEKKQQKETLEILQTEQKKRVEDVQAKQLEAQHFVDSCSKEVQDLIAKRDEEFAAAKKAAEEEAARRKQAAQHNAGKHQDSVDASGKAGSLSAVLSATRAIGSPGYGLCAMWVSQVFSRAGFAYPPGNANDMYYAWCKSSNRSQLKPGMIVAVSSHPHTRMGKIYGHIGIYVGGGQVMHNIGYIKTESIDSWISFYGASVPVRWGWVFGRPLS